MQKYEAAGAQLVDAAKNLLHEGNSRKISITRGSQTVAEFPLTFGILGAVVAPAVAALAAIAALASDCTVKVERVAEPPAA